jgi:Helix-turn-helix domain
VGEELGATDRRTTVAEAAQILGISAEAVRGRIRRGTLPVVREGGTVYVLIDRAADERTTGDQTRTTDDQPSDRPGQSSALISAKDELIATLREQLEQANERDRENRRIIAALTQRIPAIEAQEPPEAPETATETPMGPTPSEASDAEQEGSVPRRSWWQRMTT